MKRVKESKTALFGAIICFASAITLAGARASDAMITYWDQALSNERILTQADWPAWALSAERVVNSECIEPLPFDPPLPADGALLLLQIARSTAPDGLLLLLQHTPGTLPLVALSAIDGALLCDLPAVAAAEPSAAAFALYTLPFAQYPEAVAVTITERSPTTIRLTLLGDAACISQYLALNSANDTTAAVAEPAQAPLVTRNLNVADETVADTLPQTPPAPIAIATAPPLAQGNAKSRTASERQPLLYIASPQTGARILW